MDVIRPDAKEQIHWTMVSIDTLVSVGAKIALREIPLTHELERRNTQEKIQRMGYLLVWRMH